MQGREPIPVTTHTSQSSTLQVGDKVTFSDVLADGEPLDPPPPLAVLLHKPVGYVVTAPDDERVAGELSTVQRPARHALLLANSM